MENMLIISQDKKFTGLCKFFAIGRRTATQVIGDKLSKYLEEVHIDKEKLIEALGNSYRSNIERILKNDEIPNPKLLKKIISYFNLEDDYFEEKELENVIVTDNGVVVGTYENNKRALEIKTSIDEVIKECRSKGNAIIIELPEK